MDVFLSDMVQELVLQSHFYLYENLITVSLIVWGIPKFGPCIYWHSASHAHAYKAAHAPGLSAHPLFWMPTTPG